MASVFLDKKDGKRVTVTGIATSDLYVLVDNGRQIERYDYVGDSAGSRVYRHTDSNPKAGVPQT